MQNDKEEKLNSISMHDFLDFLKLTCQVHQSITTKEDNTNGKNELDYNKLARNELVNSLLNSKADSSASPKSGDADKMDNSGAVSNNSPDKKGMFSMLYYYYF